VPWWSVSHDSTSSLGVLQPRSWNRRRAIARPIWATNTSSTLSRKQLERGGPASRPLTGTARRAGQTSPEALSLTDFRASAPRAARPRAARETAGESGIRSSPVESLSAPSSAFRCPPLRARRRRLIETLSQRLRDRSCFSAPAWMERGDASLSWDLNGARQIHPAAPDHGTVSSRRGHLRPTGGAQRGAG